ncbi:MAG TPA: hypothetical protein V6C84_02385 [Coleofasciculaceae cyanobacterium]|jgi:hypothetical protein
MTLMVRDRDDFEEAIAMKESCACGSIQLYVKSKVPWFEIADELLQYPEVIDLRV